jgi:hypothetical protein
MKSLAFYISHFLFLEFSSPNEGTIKNILGFENTRWLRARSNWLWAVAVSLPLSLFFLRHVSCLLTYEFVYIVTYVYIVMYPMSGESNKLKN